MPTYAELVAAVTDFVADYAVILYAAAAVGLIFWGLKRFLKAGR